MPSAPLASKHSQVFCNFDDCLNDWTGLVLLLPAKVLAVVPRQMPRRTLETRLMSGQTARAPIG